MDKLIGFGASTVEGVGDSAGGFFRRIGKKLAAKGRPHERMNFGVGGNTTRDMLARLHHVLPHLPAKVIVQFGSNDLPRESDESPASRTPLDEFSRNAEKILQALGGPNAIFISSFAVCPARTGIDPILFTAYMETALKIAGKTSMKIWDMHAESKAWGDRYLAADGLHYNDAGHELMAEKLLTLV